MSIFSKTQVTAVFLKSDYICYGEEEMHYALFCSKWLLIKCWLIVLTYAKPPQLLESFGGNKSAMIRNALEVNPRRTHIHHGNIRKVRGFPSCADVEFVELQRVKLC